MAICELIPVQRVENVTDIKLAYWLLGAMCSTPSQAGKLVAIYKVSQSVGAAIAYQLTTDNLSARKQFISNWALIAVTLVVACKP